jgi:hypothetical protein
MALWSNSEANTSAPKYAVAGGLGVSVNGDTLYANTDYYYRIFTYIYTYLHKYVRT